MSVTEQVSREEWQRMREENTAKVVVAVEDLEERLEDEDFSHIWFHVRETTELFRLKPLDREQQPVLWKRYQAVRERLTAIQEANVEEVERALSHLKNEHPLSHLNELAIDANRVMGFGRIFNMDHRIDFAAIWADVKEVSTLLHEKSLMQRADRERLKDELNRFRDKLRDIQDNHKRRYEDDCQDTYNEIDKALDALENVSGFKEFSEQRRSVADMLKNLRPFKPVASQTCGEDCVSRRQAID